MRGLRDAAAAVVADPDVCNDIDELLAHKRQAAELEWLPARPRLNAFIAERLAGLHQAQPAIGRPNMEPLADTVLDQR
jgi:hypothetical protein